MVIARHVLPNVSRYITRGFSSVGDSWINLEKKADGIMNRLQERGETVGVAETATGGLISAALWSSPVGSRAFKGAGVRLVTGIDRKADAQGIADARSFANKSKNKSNDMSPMSSPAAGGVGWALVYENGDQHSETGSAVHALELAHSAKLNLGTNWGIGESSIPGPEVHRRTGLPSGMGFVAVAGPTEDTTGVLKINESGVGGGSSTRSSNMARFTNAALDLMAHLQSKQ